MLKPKCFGFNTQTAVTNYFQQNENDLMVAGTSEKAEKEFDDLRQKIINAGINVVCLYDTLLPEKPDAVFLNNWFSTHDEGSVFIYPMLTHNRRAEKRPELIDLIKGNFKVTRIFDWSSFEDQNIFLEGTGSMVVDRKGGKVYAALSPRTSQVLVFDFAEKMNLKPVLFSAFDDANRTIYHTNVMMALGNGFAVVCADSISNKNERKVVISSLEEEGYEIILISLEQVNNFAGNLLQLQNTNGDFYLIMSTRAYDVLTLPQIAAIKRHTSILYADLSTIETIGGGGARCMLAEMFLTQI